MPTIKYVGSKNNWPELSVTGKQSVWLNGQQEFRSQDEAMLLLGTGLFDDVSSSFATASIASQIQTLKPLGATGQNVSAAFTFNTAWMVEGDYNAVRFQYANYGGTTYTITSAKTAPSPTLGNNGTGLTHTSVTFDNAATALAGDVWNGTAGSVTSYVVPVALSGSGANTVPKFVYSDWIAQTPVACTEAGKEDLRIIQHRAYVATATGYSALNAGTSATNMGVYNTYARRSIYGQITAGDHVGTVTAVTPLANHQWFLCTAVQAMLIKPIYNHGIFGDSISKGQGSFDNNNGTWSWSHIASQELTLEGIGRHSVVSYACSGQGKAATWLTFLEVIRQGGLETATMFPWSANDGNSAGSAPWALNNFKFHISAFIEECRKYNVRPILATQPPSSTITDGASDLLRIALNSLVRSLEGSGVGVADFDVVVSNNASPARYITGLTNGDNQHPSLLGYQAMAVKYKEAVKNVLGFS